MVTLAANRADIELRNGSPSPDLRATTVHEDTLPQPMPRFTATVRVLVTAYSPSLFSAASTPP
jgi:hypothetical protein